MAVRVRLFAAVAVAQASDLITFAWIMPIVGLQAESNGYAVRLYAAFGLAGIVALKFAATVVILGLLLRVRRPDLRRVAAGLGIAIGLVGFVGNLGALLR